MRACLVLLLMTVTAILAQGCVSEPEYTQAQLTAIETRQVDADMDATFRAASSALFDSGYTIAMSDRTGGLLTGTCAKMDQEAYWFGTSRTPIGTYTISMQMIPDGAQRTNVPIKTAVNRIAVVQKAEIDRIWVLMQRQVMMNEPLKPAPPTPPTK